MGSLTFKFFFFTNIDDRLSQTLCVTGLPICPVIIVCKVSNDELRISNFDAHDVVDKTGLRNITHIDQIVTGSCLDHRFYNILDEFVQIMLSELHGHKAVLSLKFTALFRFVPIPSVESEINAQKQRPVIDVISKSNLDKAKFHQLFNEL